MKINQTTNQNFGRIYVSPAMKTKILKLAKKENQSLQDTFVRNWNYCVNTKTHNLRITDDGRVFVENSVGGRFSEDILRSFIWNVDSGLKRIMSFDIRPIIQ